MDDQIQTIKKIIQETLEKLCVDFDEVQFIDESGFKNGVKFMVKTNDPGVLIGADGITLRAFNHLVKKIIWRKIKGADYQEINFFVDVNDYQSKNIDRIKTKALDLAKRADLFKRDIEMEAMSSYERMIAHSVLADNPKIQTESVGEGDLRRVVIKTKN
ncbi:MAG: hypothetical protein KAV41_01715 [Candidatus Pacebacteria bacterium]|nr:hypothetical protein [Candidatus Paceibacterota bacterium]